MAVGERNRVSTMKTHGVLHADYYEHETAEALASMSMRAARVTQRPRGRLLGINTWRSLSPRRRTARSRSSTVALSTPPTSSPR